MGADTSSLQRKMAETLEGDARRMAALEALSIESGQSILDLGCGGGHLVHKIALAVGDGGRAVGLDLNTKQLSAAQELCDGLPAIELVKGDATNMTFEDGNFDAVATIQTLEYVADVDAALSEVRRVLKHGGKVASISVLWNHWRFHGADPELNDRMHEVWSKHCRHQMLPLEMPGKLVAAGFGGVTQRPMAIFNGTMHNNSFAFWAARIVTVFTVGKGVAEEDAALWLEQLSKADREGRFGFVSVPVLTTAVSI